MIHLAARDGDRIAISPHNTISEARVVIYRYEGWTLKYLIWGGQGAVRCPESRIHRQRVPFIEWVIPKSAR